MHLSYSEVYEKAFEELIQRRKMIADSFKEEDPGCFIINCCTLKTKRVLYAWCYVGKATRMMSATIRRKALSLCSSALANNGIVQSLERVQPALAGSAARGYVAGIPMFEAFGRGSKLVPEFHQGAPVYSKSMRDVVSSLKSEFPTQKWIRSFSSCSENAVRGDINEPISQIQTNKHVQHLCDQTFNFLNHVDVANPEVGVIKEVKVLEYHTNWVLKKCVFLKGVVAPVIEDVAKMSVAEIKKTHNGPAFFTVSGAAIGSALSTPIANAPQAAQLGVGSTLSPTFLPNLALFWHINNGMEEIIADYVHHEMTRSLVLVLMRLFLIVAAKDCNYLETRNVVRGDINESIAQIETNNHVQHLCDQTFNFLNHVDVANLEAGVIKECVAAPVIEDVAKMSVANSSNKRKQNGPTYFTACGAVIRSALNTPCIFNR
ncbi:hypothetical protein OSB04_002682 [Centaurea solstitialis]|uniref:Uncharacterized protein n=1 Tax=Centaurea solstitialis TaxID=347529 RepID=A0AA38U5Y9_9ASTR|nr:hypothetical protein OSB04_002682 [Centaurea solstitialis]